MQKNKTKIPKEPTHRRSNYVDHSRRFVEWVNGLGLERTWFGRLAQTLDSRFKLRRLALLVLFSLALSFLITLDVDFVYTGFREGDIASTDVKSPISFDFVDELATAKKRLEAEDSVPFVFDLDLGLYEGISNNVYRSFREMRRILAAQNWPRSETQKQEAIKAFLVHKPKFDELLGTSPIPDNLFEWLASNRFSISVENAIVRALERLSNRKITADLQLLKQENEQKIIVRILEAGGTGEEFTADTGELVDIYNLHRFMEEEVGIRGFNAEDTQKIQRFVELVAAPNLTLNKQETAVRQAKAQEAILPVITPIKKNQNIIREGSVIQPSQIMLMDEIRRLKSNQRREFISLVMAFMFVSIMVIFFSYVRRFTSNKVKLNSKDLTAMATVTLIMVLVCKVFIFISSVAFEERFGQIIPSSAFMFMIPIAAGPMLVGLLITSGEIVWLFTIFLSTVVAMMVDENFTFFLFSIVGGIAAARGVYGCKKRNDIYFAGVRAGLVNMLIIAFVSVVMAENQTPLGNVLLWNIPAGFISGVMSSLVAMMFVPLLESVFNYSTDVKLLELSNLNHPLLKEMIVKAPGTYHHSLVVGSMVEAAAEEISANPLLAKVSAYYHDIGKTEHAGYFIENQRSGYNPHDHISPNMSKTVLIAHVKDGVELGEEYKLGQPIVDVIRQHHGTTLISYFYHKAKQSEDISLYSVTEEEFRYPGPKPQFKEAALCMLADSIEAAARCLDEPHPVRLQNIVKNIIHSKFMDGQLDECNLTLRDLSVIENSFNRILLGIYHQRIDYPSGRKSGDGSASGAGGSGGKKSIASV